MLRVRSTLTLGPPQRRPSLPELLGVPELSSKTLPKTLADSETQSSASKTLPKTLADSETQSSASITLPKAVADSESFASRMQRRKHKQLDKLSTTCHFPLTVMPMKEFMRLDRLENFDTMYKRKLTVQDVPTSAKILFISHEWLGFNHPDEDGVHLKRIQEVFDILLKGKASDIISDAELKDLTENSHLAACFSESGFTEDQAGFTSRNNSELHDEHGTLQEQLEGAYVWLDYFSIPQMSSSRATIEQIATVPSMDAVYIDNAVKSIPYYVERSSFFFVVAPKAKHSDEGHTCDLTSWRSRGWCRLEEWANNLSLNSKCPVIVTETNVMVQSWEDYVVLVGGTRKGSVACGEFTCCQLGHQIDHSTVPGMQGVQALKCDIPSCVQVLSAMWRDKLAYAKSKNFKVMERYLVLSRCVRIC